MHKSKLQNRVKYSKNKFTKKKNKLCVNAMRLARTTTKTN